MNLHVNSLALVLALGIGSGPVLAHHSFAAEFDIEKPINLQGTVTEVEFINPHSWIHIDVADETGHINQWEIEGGTPNTLFRRGIDQNTLAEGTTIVVDGYQSRDGSNRASGRNITLADGSQLFLQGNQLP